MKFLPAIIPIVIIAILSTSFSFSQNGQIYKSDLQKKDIPSADFRVKKPEVFITKAKSLALKQPDSALYLASKAILVAQDLELSNWEAQAFRRMGVILIQNEDYMSAIHYLLRAQELFESRESVKDLRLVYNNLGVAYEYLGENRKAISYYFKSLEQAEIEGNIEKQLLALSNLGEHSLKVKQFKSAQDFFYKGIALAKKEKETRLVPRMQSQLAMSMIHLDKFEEAEKYLLESHKYYEPLQQDSEGNQLALANIYNGLGLIAKYKKNSGQAEVYYNKAITIYEDIKSTQIVVPLTNIGNLAFENKKYDTAEKLYQRALSHPYFTIDPFRNKDLYLNLSLTFGQLNELDSAYKYQNQYVYLTDSIYESDIIETVSRAELLYTQARNERAQDKANRAFERQKTLSNYLMGALSIAGLLALVFYLSMRNYAQRKESLRKELLHKEESNKLMLIEMLKDHEVENLNAMLDGQESERKRIARDLHDSLGGTLAAVQLTLASLSRKIPDMPELAENTYRKAENLLDQAYQQMRGISHNLVDLSLKDGGLSPALKQLNETLSENTHIEIRMNYESLGKRRLDSNVEQHSYRITQELFQNIIKHAEASLIEYELTYSPVKLQISIKDDGKGFSYEPGNKVAGIGLNNILTRVRQLEGEMDIQTKPGEGTRIAVDIPLVLS